MLDNKEGIILYYKLNLFAEYISNKISENISEKLDQSSIALQTSFKTALEDFEEKIFSIKKQKEKTRELKKIFQLKFRDSVLEDHFQLFLLEAGQNSL